MGRVIRIFFFGGGGGGMEGRVEQESIAKVSLHQKGRYVSESNGIWPLCLDA